MRPFVLPSVSSTSITISGKFYLNETSTATSGYLVYLAYTNTSGSSLRYYKSKLTDSSGGFTFNNVKPGNYQIVTEAQPFSTANSSTVERRVTSDTNIKVSENEVKLEPRQPYLGSIVGANLYLGTVGGQYPNLPWTLYFDGQPTVSITSPTAPIQEATAWAAMTFPVRFDHMSYSQPQYYWDDIYQIGLSEGFLSLRQIVISNPGSGYPLRPAGGGGPRTLAELSGANVCTILPLTNSTFYGTSASISIQTIIDSGGEVVQSLNGLTTQKTEGDPPVTTTYPLLYSITKTPVSGYLEVILSRNYNEFRTQTKSLNYYNGCNETRADNVTFDARMDGRSFVFDQSDAGFNDTPGGSIGWRSQPVPYRHEYIYPGTPKPATSAVLVTRSFNTNVKPSNSSPINPSNNAVQTGELSAYKKLTDALGQIFGSGISSPYSAAGQWSGSIGGSPLYFDVIHGDTGSADAAYRAGEFGPVGSAEAIWKLDQIKGYIGRELLVNAAVQGTAGSFISDIINNEYAVNNNSNIQRLWNLPNKTLDVLGGFLANVAYQYGEAIVESSSFPDLAKNILKETASLGRQTWGTFSDTPPDWLVGKSWSGSLADGRTVQFSFNSGGYNRTVTP